MADSADPEQLKFVENEINLGFTFLRTYALSAGAGHTAHANQALGNARAAWKGATEFLYRLTPECINNLSPSLLDLEMAIGAHSDSQPQVTDFDAGVEPPPTSWSD